MTDTKLTLADELAIKALRHFADEIERGMLSATRTDVHDDVRYEVRVQCCLGQRAEKLLAVEEREAELNPPDPSTVELKPSGAAAFAAYRDPVPADRCPHCRKREGQLRPAGDLEWLCLSCQHQWAPFGAKRGG